jgi:PAS domain S-box-containing protein
MSSAILLHNGRSDKHGFPLRMFAAAFLISISTTAITGWQLWQAHNRFEELSRKHIALTEGVGRIMLLDEALTMSARLAAATGDFSYEKTYDQLDPQLSTAINDVRAVLPQPDIEGFVRETDEANLALVIMERKAFALTHQGRRQEAMALLNGNEYARFKKVYAEGMQKTINAKNGLLERDIRHLHMLSLQSAAVTSAGVLVLLAAWFFAARSARSWETERMESESVLREARDELDVRVKQRTADLLDTNHQLQHEIAEHEQSEAALRESEERYRSLVELSPEAVVVHSEGMILYINASGVKIFGAATPGEMVGRPIKDFVHPDYWVRVMNRVRQVQENHQPAPLQELIFKRLNGQAFNVETAGVPITLSGKTASLTIVRDITDRKQTDGLP